jgi:hypothetical protein
MLLPPRDRVCDHFVIARYPLRPGRIERPGLGCQDPEPMRSSQGQICTSLDWYQW